MRAARAERFQSTPEKKEETTMKKLTAVILILALACAALPASAEEWADYHCSEMQF